MQLQTALVEPQECRFIGLVVCVWHMEENIILFSVIKCHFIYIDLLVLRSEEHKIPWVSRYPVTNLKVESVISKLLLTTVNECIVSVDI